MINEYTEYGSQQCSGDTGTDPYKQACAGDWQFDVYDSNSSNALWLQFFSNHNGTDKGFVIAYQDTSLQLCTTPTVTDHLIISSAHQNDIFNHGDVITFTCKQGYGLIGESLMSCQDDGQWSNNIPTCTAVSCGVPPSSANAYHANTDYTYQNTVYY
ncbi:complement C1r-B subcomponent-like [Saccoglossus kowalevskii]|uniref:CUB and sushi domain-containing protein 3-like n=1 Tax=Saccoglossus kowalevskii TaxID=10224 RepID=A0ABM0MFC9_SACKO|nr:PREDICTED: CUB and sushi domain-containing protein 3-like [Saccoglossus kowalevskii]